MGNRVWLLLELATLVGIQTVWNYNQSGRDWWVTLEHEALLGAAAFLLFALLFVAADLGAGQAAALFGGLIVLSMALAVTGSLGPQVTAFLESFNPAAVDKAAQASGSAQGTKSGGTQ